MASTRLVVSAILILVCTLALAQGRSSSNGSDIHAEIVKKVKHETQKAVENVHKWIENYKKNAEKYNNLHPKIQEIVNEQVKKAVEKHVKESVKEVIDSAKLLASLHHSSQTSSYPRERQSHEHNKHNNKKNNDKECGGSEENSSVQEERVNNSNSSENDDPAQFHSQLNDIVRKIKDLKSGFRNRWNGNRDLAKSQLEAKLDDLRKALRKSARSSYDNNEPRSSKDDDGSDDVDVSVDDVNVIIEGEINGTAENQNVTARDIWSYISETLKTEINELRSAKQRLLKAKEDVIDAANELHAASRNHSFDFQLLIQFKSQLYDMLNRKRQYIKQRLLFKRQVREAINNFFNPNPEGTTNSAQDSSTEGPQDTAADSAVSTAEDDDRTTQQIEQTTEQVGPTAEQDAPTTKQAGPTTEQAGPTTKQVGLTTEQAERSTTYVGQTTGNDGQTSTQAPISHQISSTNDSAVEAFQVPDEYASTENEEEGTNGSQTRTVLGRAHNSSSSNANNSDANGLRLSANYMGSGGDDDSDGDGTVVVVVVLSCLVICSVVSVLAVLVWKRHRRQRLYTRIPSGDVSRQFL